ncbi:S1/P1 nuclease [Reichenbachiella versicolor]|uniref:S1/P1 nuclease n=1 Tax=Reichenbachiella versicolor TaxID=1821036 RepID=UPI000D6DE146|nr:S1/P1 nuclease [Reichenbachiella versicolor]
MKPFQTLILLLLSTTAFGWGQTGHRVVGQIAFEHLTPKAKKNIKKVLHNEPLGLIGNYMDFVRSDPNMNYMAPWHYCTIPDEQSYEEAGIPEKSDVIQQIIRITSELKSKEFTYESELENLKYLVHLIADIHQPLHVGNGQDKGGNTVEVEFMWKETNLHRVWDTDMIDHQKLSYTEYSEWINHPTKEQIQKWQSEDVLKWALEGKDLRSQVYNIPENKKLSYRYIYDNISTLNERLLRAGVRLAGVLNEIYG